MTLRPPAADEIEVTLIGPGFGESVLIHPGANKWIIVDSCLDPQSGEPAALSYLQQMGVDVSVDVLLVCATHWHDDHIGGMFRLVESCASAPFVCSSAFHHQDFVDLMHVFNKNVVSVEGSGLSEIQKVFLALRKRRTPPKFAMADRPLFSIDDGSGGTLCRVTALSPSDLDFQRFLAKLSSLAPRRGITKFRLPAPTPNEVSVAMWVRIRETDILLGADLEESGQTGRGWIAVLDSSERPQGRAAVFKVAHHGSITGHHDRIWTELLVDAPVAILTPWNRGSKLPTSADCSRIIDLTPNAYVTSHPRAPKKQTQEQAVARTLRESGIRVSYTEPDPGYVQLRRAHGAATWVVHLSPEARALAAAAH